MRNYTCKALILAKDNDPNYRKELTFYVDGKNKKEAEANVVSHLNNTLLRSKQIYLKSLTTSVVTGKKDSNDLRRELNLDWTDGWLDGFMDIRNRTFVVFSHIVDMDRKYSYLPTFLVTARTSDSAFQQVESYLYSMRLRYYEDTYNATCTDRQEAVDDTLSLPFFKKGNKPFYSKEDLTQGKIDIRTQK